MLVIPILAALALASEPPSPEAQKPKVEEAIVVTATRSERAVSELPVSTSVVGEEAIESAPVRSVDDLIRTIPGVHTSIVSGSGSTPNNQRLSMRGLGGTRALVLLDGVPIHDPYSGVVQWQKVSLDSLGQVEVVRGGNTSLFGNFALGGTINLITRPVDDSRVALDLSAGSGSTQQQRLTVDKLLGRRAAIRVSYDRNDANGFLRVPNPGPVDVPAWIDNWIAAARADFTLSDTSKAFVKTSLAQVDVSQGTPVTFTNRDIFESSAGFHLGTTANSILSASAFHQRQKERLVNSTILGNRLSEFRSQDGTIPSTVHGGSLEWSMQRRGVLPFLSLGVDVRKTEASESRITFNRSGVITQRNRVGGEQTSAGLFAQTSWQPSDALEVLVSARLDHFRNENGSDAIEGGETTLYPSSSFTQLDPRLSVRYAIGARSALRASVYRAFGAPTLRDLYRKNQTGNSVVLGNPYLEPETLTGGEVGFEWAGAHARVEMNLFRSTIEGLQSRANVPGQPSNVFQQMNLGTGRSQGIELIADARLTRKWTINAGYTYADATITEDPDPAIAGNLIPEVAPHIGSLGVRFRGDRGTTVDFRGRVVSRSYGEVANQAVSPAHRVVDLSLSQRVRPWLDVYGAIENAFDEVYWLALTTSSFRSG
ncbi:MAG TPA: TonB-dependent receptor, partial [Thermoanaerobaculia bacterium]|nr:TonB-dependent receptor [Thermoanaerobaculia bacterium]